MRHATRLIATTAAAMAALTGCSQVQGLATQGNMNVIYLATAAIDVLTEQRIGILEAPTCSVDSATNYTCHGVATSGEKILVSVPDEASNEDPVMTIKIGDRTVYHGSVLDVIEANSRATP